MLIYLIVDILRSKRGVGRPGETPAGRSPVDTTGKINLCCVHHHYGSLTKHAARREPLPVDRPRVYWTPLGSRRPAPATGRPEKNAAYKAKPTGRPEPGRLPEGRRSKFATASSVQQWQPKEVQHSARAAGNRGRLPPTRGLLILLPKWLPLPFACFYPASDTPGRDLRFPALGPKPRFSGMSPKNKPRKGVIERED